MIGRIMTASTMPTVRMVRPVPETVAIPDPARDAGAKSGNQPTFSASQA